MTHGATDGSFVQISGVTGNVGGIPNAEINANQQITLVNTFSFFFTVATTATSTVSGSGGTAISISFEIEPGNAITTAGYGGVSGVLVPRSLYFCLSATGGWIILTTILLLISATELPTTGSVGLRLTPLRRLQREPLR